MTALLLVQSHSCQKNPEVSGMLQVQALRHRLSCIFPAFTLLPKHYSTNTAVGATMKRVLVPVANGSEEIEAVSIIDTLRRAGADVTGTV